MSNMPACITPSKLKMHGLKCSTPAKYYSFPLATIILKAVSYTWFPVSTQTSTQSHSGNILITQYMLFICPFLSQKWLLKSGRCFSHSVPHAVYFHWGGNMYTDFPGCKEKILKQLKETITALENCNCSGKSTYSTLNKTTRFWLVESSAINPKLYSVGVPIKFP